MPAPSGHKSPLARSSRAVPALSRAARLRDEHVRPPRERRGILNAMPLEWRRCEGGTNHITNLGVWRLGMRREAPRLNRSGATLWHRPPFGKTSL
jgi:hypothetical protein